MRYEIDINSEKNEIEVFLLPEGRHMGDFKGTEGIMRTGVRGETLMAALYHLIKILKDREEKP